MMSSSDTSLVEEEGVDVDGVDQDGAKRKGGAADSCCNLNCASLCFGSGIYGTNMSEMVGHRKRDEKMVQNPRDSGRKDKLITGRQIQMNINGKNKVRRKINSKMLKEG